MLFFLYCWPGKGTIVAVLIMRMIQEEYLSKQTKLHMCFVDLEKVFDRVPRKDVEWAMGKKGIPGALGNGNERYSRSIGQSSDEAVQTCNDKSESWNTFI